MTNLISFLKATEEKIGDEFDLNQLASGDELIVTTRHTDYGFKIISDRLADLSCSRADRPRAQVKIMGCTFGNSSSIKPDHLFCGGNLEFTYEIEGRRMVHKTTAIKAIYWRRKTK